MSCLESSGTTDGPPTVSASVDHFSALGGSQESSHNYNYEHVGKPNIAPVLVNNNLQQMKFNQPELFENNAKAL